MGDLGRRATGHVWRRSERQRGDGTAFQHAEIRPGGVAVSQRAAMDTTRGKTVVLTWI